MFGKRGIGSGSALNLKEEVMRNLLLVTGVTFALFFSAAAADEAANKAVGFETKPLLKANKTWKNVSRLLR